ncbi:hypothetical protein OM076_13500 [Solirubrobacter ginsenosidimutans]|uniref:Magnesium transporter CorA family protein n=1 Tax=Solirubrobacter ginsenosidimutans TaxID=490573 RepID=A0A9X3MTP5_9ACTN|nr:CorA family divalent cation transporter [Solirubrobacter ginsenosidimutans]MDA0161287.1 hypothetical protein [Solirubrobacter ginsenosidimutans]
MTNLQADRATAEALAEEVAASTSSRRTWRKVTTLLDRFGVHRLTTPVRHRIAEALDVAGLLVEPPFTEVERYGTVRLSLRGRSSPETNLPIAAADEAIRVTFWRAGQPPRELMFSAARAGDGVLWLDVDVSQLSEASALLGLLQPLCENQLNLAMLEDLFEADSLPKVRAYTEDTAVRCVSSFAVRAEEDEANPDNVDESKAGSLVFQPVEFLAGERWLVSCWHRARITRDGADEAGELTPEDHSSLVEEIAERWPASGLSSAGDLGLMVLYELARTYTRSRRVLYAWHDQWELDFFRRRERTETVTLLRMRGLIAHLKEHLEALNQPGMSKNPRLVWFAHATDGVEAERIDDIIDRALANLRALGDTLRASIDLHATLAFAQQSRRAEHFQELVAIVAAVVLIPTLVAGIFGANTRLPGEGTWLGFGLMIAAMVLSGVLAYAAIRGQRGRGHRK